jgi:hypothetical protein
MADGREYLVEVKPARQLARPATLRKLAAADLFARGRGVSFRLLTEREVRQGFLLANARLLRRYLRLPADPGLLERLAARVPAPGVRLGELLREAGPVEVALPHALHLLCTGRVSFDPLPGPVGPDTPVFPKGALPWDPFASAWAPSGCSTGAPTASSGSPPPTSSSPST